MKITSHFIGIKINDKVFIDLSKILQQYITKNNLSLSIELQDIHSLHITLYYLPQEIPPKELTSIKNTLEMLRATYKDFLLTQNKVAYFKKDENEYLCYIACTQVKELEELNRQLANQYHKTEIADNQYTYIPHISLFKVLNHDVFLQHKESINSLLMKAVGNIKENLFQGFFLYEVDSNFHPEMQRIVESF